MNIFSTRKSKVESFLREQGVSNLKHESGASLSDHLLRTASVLEKWGLDEETVLAGMLHSAYSTQFYKTGFLEKSERGVIKSLVGEYIEKTIFIYCELDRETLQLEDSTSVSYKSIEDGELKVLDSKTSRSIVNILFANELDHVTPANHGYITTSFGFYLQCKGLLCEKAQNILEKISRDKPQQDTAYIRAIAHSGIEIHSNYKKILIDPWIYPSTFDSPIIKSIDPYKKTIDFIVPEPQLNINDLECDVVCISHFHTHHSPLKEIAELAKKRPITLICPRLDPSRLLILRENLSEEVFDRITFIFLDYFEDGTRDNALYYSLKNNTPSSINKQLSREFIFTFENFIIKCIPHTSQFHFAFYVESRDFSVLHITDSLFNRDFKNNTIDIFWEQFYALKPDYLFIGVSDAKLKLIDKDLNRIIMDSAGLSPVQAAKIIEKILPKHVGLIGIDNFSIWCNRTEYRPSNGEIHNEFEWAVAYLAPSVDIIKLRSGVVYYKV